MLDVLNKEKKLMEYNKIKDMLKQYDMKQIASIIVFAYVMIRKEREKIEPVKQ